MVVVAILPVVGVPLFFVKEQYRATTCCAGGPVELENTLRPQLPQNREVVERLRRAEPGAASLAKYLHGPGGGFPVYGVHRHDLFPQRQSQVCRAAAAAGYGGKVHLRRIFHHRRGAVWGRVLEILARKAAEGVDVRVMYDGTCEFSTLPRDYPKRLEALGIQCKVRIISG